jgi:hypothetical protein
VSWSAWLVLRFVKYDLWPDGDWLCVFVVGVVNVWKAERCSC